MGLNPSNDGRKNGAHTNGADSQDIIANQQAQINKLTEIVAQLQAANKAQPTEEQLAATAELQQAAENIKQSQDNEKSITGKAHKFVEVLESRVSELNGVPKADLSNFSFDLDSKSAEFQPTISVDGTASDLLTEKGITITKTHAHIDGQAALHITQTDGNPDTFELTVSVGQGAEEKKYVFAIEANKMLSNTKDNRDGILQGFAEYGNDPNETPQLANSSLIHQLQKGGAKLITSKSSPIKGFDLADKAETFSLSGDQAIDQYTEAIKYQQDSDTEAHSPEAKNLKNLKEELMSAEKAVSDKWGAIWGTDEGTFRGALGFISRGTKEFFASFFRRKGSLTQLSRNVRALKKSVDAAEQELEKAKNDHEPEKVEQDLQNSLMENYEGTVFEIDPKNPTNEGKLLSKVAVPAEYKDELIPSFGSLAETITSRVGNDKAAAVEGNNITLRRVNAENEIEELTYEHDRHGRVKVSVNDENVGYLSNHLAEKGMELFMSGKDASKIFKKKDIKDHELKGKYVVKALDKDPSDAPQLTARKIHPEVQRAYNNNVAYADAVFGDELIE